MWSSTRHQHDVMKYNLPQRVPVKYCKIMFNQSDDKYIMEHHRACCGQPHDITGYTLWFAQHRQEALGDNFAVVYRTTYSAKRMHFVVFC